MNSIFGESAGDLSFEELYRTGYNMVLHKHGEKLYESVEGLLNSRTKDICVEIKSANEATFLEEVKSKWLAHKRSLKMVRDILMYMDRTYVKQTPKMPVYDKGVNLFCRNCIQEPHVKKRLSDLLLELVEKERKGEKVDRDVIKNSTQMLMEMGKEVFHEVRRPAFSHPHTSTRPKPSLSFSPLIAHFLFLFASLPLSTFFPLKLSHFPM